MSSNETQALGVGNYVIVSPVKDESAYVERTIDSIVMQTVRPRKWIIVDDGSRDATPEILSRCSQQHPWITVIRLERDAERQPGSAVIRAFMAGYKEVENDDFEFVVKLDCDLEIPSNYFENLVSRFAADQRLGIASGMYQEMHAGVWTAIEMPEYHAAGCSKMVRAECFRQISGFVPQRGWDTVDEIRAQSMGWKTGHFPELAFHHLKTEGAGIGTLRTSLMHGQIYYLTGGGVLFFLLKVAHRALKCRPILIAGVAMLLGFLRAWITREPRLVSDREAAWYQGMLTARIRARWNEMFFSQGNRKTVGLS
jgi:biofilm PGA synthesis N-glycosyltransferase PgaC